MGRLLIVLLFSMSFYFSNAQTQNDLSIVEIRQYVKKVQYSLKDNKVSMYVSSDYDGNRWICIKDLEINGLKSDEAYVSFEYTKLYVKMLYLAINYDLENPISLTYFPNLMLSKGIKGVQFITGNNEFFFKWDEIMNKIKSKSN